MPIFRRRSHSSSDSEPVSPPPLAAPTRRVQRQAGPSPASTPARVQANVTRRVERADPDIPSLNRAAANMTQAAPMRLVVGWLVVVNGPGRGHFVSLYAGANGIGRGSMAQIQLDFGDSDIAEGDHAVISYSPDRRHFHAFSSQDTVLAINGVTVEHPVRLTGGEFLTLGSTRLLFIPLCNEQFDWEDDGI